VQDVELMALYPKVGAETALAGRIITDSFGCGEKVVVAFEVDDKGESMMLHEET